MNNSARKAANLKLLTRTCDASINDILASSTHVVLYEFTGASWTKMGVEGSIFLVSKGSSSAEFDCIILNRSTPNNFTLQVTANLQLQDQPPYLIVKVPSTMQVLVERLKNPVPVPEVAPEVPPDSISSAPAIDYEATKLLASKLLVMGLTGEDDAATAGNDSDVAEPIAFSSPPAFLNNESAAVQAASAPVAAAATPAAASNHQRLQSAPTPPRHGSPAGAGVALDKKSLQLALLSLIQDDRFLDLLHSQYLRVIHSRAKAKRDGDVNK
ncbi:hypothetical protein MPSEU_000306200 [Mayamaea pseudoterrestris]|nr:hypothetical protein MPSEU_000306200 [Mayamaea pseudoterrestris]